MDHSFIWEDSAENAFSKLKYRVASKQVLITFKPDYPIIVTTDTSKKSRGAVLETIFLRGNYVESPQHAEQNSSA